MSMRTGLCKKQYYSIGFQYFNKKYRNHFFCYDFDFVKNLVGFVNK